MTTLRIAVAMALACGLVASAGTPIARAAEGDVTFGGQWWTQTDPDAKYQEFSVVPRGALLESFMLQEWSGRNGVAVWGGNAMRADQATRITWANGARFRLDLGYAEIPHLFSQVARSPYVETAPGWFTLPDSLQAKNQRTTGTYTATMRDLLDTAPVIGLGFGTSVSTARLRVRPTHGWQIEARGTRRERSGVKPYAMTFGFSTAIEIPEPIEQRMIDGDVVADYRRDRFSTQVDVGVSTFDNFISTLRVDNPKRLTDVNGGDGPKVGALDLYPDNKVVRASVAMSYLMPRNTALTATLGVSQGTQNDPFLALTNNSALPQSSLDSLPARSLDAKAVQLNGDVRLATTLAKGLGGSLRFHYTDYDNQTPNLDFIGQVPYDVSFQRYAPLSSEARSNTQWQAGGDLDYAVNSKVSVGAMGEYRVNERTVREVEKNNETVLGARARVRPMSAMQIEARYWRGDRKIDAFLDEDYEGFKQRAVGPTAGVYDSLADLEQAELRRFDVAARIQDRATAGVSYMFGERLELGATYAYLKNDYHETTFGLQDATAHTVASNGAYHVNERLDLNGGYGYERTETHQASRESGTATLSINPLDNWGAFLKDTDVFVAAGFDWWPKADKISVSANYQLSRHVAAFDLSNGRNTAQDLPTNIYRRHEAVLDASYQWLEKTRVSLRYGWEEYDILDWATNDVPLIFPLTGTANAVFLGDSSEGYRAHRVAVLVKHQF
jgi:MtrB/PioB family decaheme-associated outer membrane protein